MDAFATSALYRQHRIHVSQLHSGVWVASVVARGGRVVHLQNEFATHDEALCAAEKQVDDRLSDLRDRTGTAA